MTTLFNSDFDRDLCLTIDPEEYNLVRFVDCRSTEYEAWYYDNGKIKNKHDDYSGWCLMGSSNGESGYPEMTLCSHTDPSQLWIYDDFSLLSGEGECLDFGDPYYGNMFRCDNDDGQKYEVGRNFFELEK